MVDLFLLPKGKKWMELSAWVWEGEYPDLTQAKEAGRLKLEEEPNLWESFETQGKMVLN
jgi:hypothetical protein